MAMQTNALTPVYTDASLEDENGGTLGCDTGFRLAKTTNFEFMKDLAPGI